MPFRPALIKGAARLSLAAYVLDYSPVRQSLTAPDAAEPLPVFVSLRLRRRGSCLQLSIVRSLSARDSPGPGRSAKTAYETTRVQR
jgi:hypothetical protein